MQQRQVGADDDTSAAQVAQNVLHHGMAVGQLVMQPDILDGHADLFEQMKDERQFLVVQRLPGDASVEDGHAHERFAIEHRHGHLRPQQLELLLDLQIRKRFLAAII